MATILRSSQYIRCLNALAKRTVVAHDKNKFATKILALQAQCINSYLTKSYATRPAVKSYENTTNFDKVITKLDERVQRHGRIFKPELEDVLSKIRETGFIPSLDALLLIRCCGDLLVDVKPEERNKIVQEIWATLEILKIPIDISHFNALLRVYLENDYQFEPIDFLTTIRNKGIEPNRVTYQRLITYYCKKGDIEGATKILEFMREKGLPLNESVFNSLIIGHSEANDMESAKNMLTVMKEAGVEPCSSTYTALLCAYAKRGDMDSIRTTLNEFKIKNLYLHDKEYLTVIHALAANGHVEHVDEILTYMSKGPSYNIDASHAILKVLDVGNVDVALKILSSMKKRRSTEEESSDETNSGTFLIRKLVNSQFPAETVIKVCTQLEERGEHTRAFFVAAERSLSNCDQQLSIPVLKAWKERGGPIREHYFRPLFNAHGKAMNHQGIIGLLQIMKSEFGLTPGFETIRDYVLPFTVGKWEDIVNQMQEFGIDQETIVSAIAARMLLNKKMRKTAQLMMTYSVYYNPEDFYHPLAEALKELNDARSFVVIIRLLSDVSIKKKQESVSGDETEQDYSTDTGSVIIETAIRKALSILINRKVKVVDEILDNLIDMGINISPELGQEIRNYFGDEISPETEGKIEKLTSGTLKLVPRSGLSEFALIGNVSDRHIGNQSETVKFSNLRRNFAEQLRAGNIGEIEKTVEILDSQSFTISAALCAQIVEVFTNANNLEMAQKWLKRFKEQDPSAILDLQKTTKYAALLIKNNRFDDALQFILDSARIEDPENHGPGLRRNVKALLDVAAETGDIEKTNQLFEALMTSKYFSVDNYMLGPLVKVHLISNDLEGAMRAFENACLRHRCTPMKNELSKRLIDAEDANSLQRLTDLSTQIHGESNALVDLVLSFIECGRQRQARKILETPGLRLKGGKLRATAQRYIDEDKTDCLEQFTEITKNLPAFDRQELFDVLLDAYNKKNDWRRGLSLWTEMQDDDVQPNESFLATLANLLIRNKQPVPFIYQENLARPTKNESDYFIEFEKALEQGDLSTAEAILARAPVHYENYSTATSKLVERLLRDKDDVNKALYLIESLLVKHSMWPRTFALKLLWYTLIEHNRFDDLRKHGNTLSTNMKNKLRFHKYLNRAELREIGLHQFLTNFKSKLTDSRNDNFKLVKTELHFTTLLDELKRDPSELDLFRTIADQLAEQEIYQPINLVWCYYFEQNKPEADEIWSKYLHQARGIVYRYLVNIATENNDIELAKRLDEKLSTNKVITENAKNLMKTCLVEIYTKLGRYDDALELIEKNGIQRFNALSSANPELIETLNKELESQGKSLPYKINTS